MHSGKSYLAQWLIENHRFRRASFAAALKEDIIACGFEPKHVEEKPPWMRRLMQVYGAARRAVDENYWVDIVRDRLLEEVGDIVIDDVRFPNEVEMLRELGQEEGFEVIIIRLVRLGYDRAALPGASDRSETALDHHSDWDHVIAAPSGELGMLRDGIESALGLPHRG